MLLNEAGVHPVNPLDRDYRGKEGINWREIVENDLIAIRKSDIVLANLWKDDQPYFGTSMEIMYAHTIGVPVICVFKGSHPWLTYHSIVVDTLEEAVKVAVEMRV
jgi:nucleoside 2-deoxyribosyltransferase